MNIALRMLVALVAFVLPFTTQAGDHGGGGAQEPMVFTVNIGTANYLQFGLILEPAIPEAAGAIAAYKPKIQHAIILLMAGKDMAKLRTLEGKKELIEELVELANLAIREDEKTGVKEALFTRFLIQ